jgi:hypothetical protein
VRAEWSHEDPEVRPYRDEPAAEAVVVRSQPEIRAAAARETPPEARFLLRTAGWRAFGCEQALIVLRTAGANARVLREKTFG